MSYVGNVPTTASFPFDQFSGNGSTTAFTLSFAPAGSTSIIVTISGVVQNPNLYSISGTTITFSPAPPTGTNNIAVLYLGLPVIATTTPGNTAYFSSSVFTATAGQTVFTPSGTYQVGFLNVIRNGSQLAPADYTATNGTTVTLLNACTVGDTVVIEVFNLISIANALPATGGTVTGATTFNQGVNLAVASGNVGIGTSSPGGRLDVNGDAVFRGNFGLTTAGFVYSYAGGVNGQVRSGVQFDGNNQQTLFFTGTTERMRIDSSGNLLVGTASAPTYGSKLRVQGGIETQGFNQYNIVGTSSGADFEWVLRTGARQLFYVNNASVAASLSTAGVWTNASDARYKENITDSNYGLDAVMALKPRTYNLVDQADKPQVGFIAQEVLDVVPEVVDTTLNSITEEERYTLSYGQLTAVLTKAIQEQQQMIETLQAKVAALETGL